MGSRTAAAAHRAGSGKQELMIEALSLQTECW